ncbi:GHMP kinase [Cellulophaga baltica]|uniref:GYDIA family GHMP kinase n=1 Tax=Cellulophaga TaxID=104264 RepID=UPI001C06DE09|nr:MULTISPECIES: GYDIA family GHMP kinase [Cellulophaga]MBU2995470.1 GHMP kinase [Cellulophaga baltica]MDO6766864.1 GYDIA family GHMP kinase [Cellulophaga sp. 1_MG-2023]
MTNNFYSNGKLLITGEYGVLDGALSLAIPSKYGQALHISSNESDNLTWKSYTNKNEVWFEGVFELETLQELSSSDNDTATALSKMLNEARALNPKFLSDYKGINATTTLDFPRDWGLGSSSTLLNNIAEWANVNPYTLLWNSFSGSGYDIACAKHDTPIIYSVKNKKPKVQEVVFNPTFKEAIYFIHLNKKQNSREGIATYRKADFDKNQFTSELSELTQQFIACKDVETFKNLIINHEALVASITKQTPVKELLFSDYDGAVKSLGAWGGDFIMAVGNTNTPDYFRNKGYNTILSYNDMLL